MCPGASHLAVCYCQEVAFFGSVQDGDVEGVMHALESGVFVDVTRPVSHYQYELAKQDAKILLVSTMCSVPVTINDFHSGWNPLMYAALDGYISVVNTLLQYGATLDKPNIVRAVDKVSEH